MQQAVQAQPHRLLLRDLLRSLKNPEELLINIVTKSGTTTETVAAFEFVVASLEDKFENISERVVVTTNETSRLAQEARKKNISVLEIPSQVGGRYSVMSAAGLFPLSMIGINTDSLREGARDMTEACLKEASKNPAALSASISYLHFKNAKRINDNFFAHPELEALGQWLRQLMAESLGKDGKGITPTTSVLKDLHTTSQLQLDGPKDMFGTIIRTEALSRKSSLPKELYFEGLVKKLEGKSLAEISVASAKSLRAAYIKKKVPFVEIKLSDISPASLGQFMQFKMIETIFLAKLFGVNAFDQPAVEVYKEELRKLL